MMQLPRALKLDIEKISMSMSESMDSFYPNMQSRMISSPLPIPKVGFVPTLSNLSI